MTDDSRLRRLERRLERLEDELDVDPEREDVDATAKELERRLPINHIETRDEDGPIAVFETGEIYKSDIEVLSEYFEEVAVDDGSGHLRITAAGLIRGDEVDD